MTSLAGPVSLSYAEAAPVGVAVHDALAPVTDRCQVVGGLRRRTTLVSAVEVLVTYRMTEPDLLGGRTARMDVVLAALARLGPIAAVSESRIVVRHASGLSIHCFPYHADAVTWAWLVLQATGPASYAEVVRRGVEARGFRATDRAVLSTVTDVPFDVDDEMVLCQRAGVPYVEPRERAAWALKPGPVPTSDGRD